MRLLPAFQDLAWRRTGSSREYITGGAWLEVGLCSSAPGEGTEPCLDKLQPSLNSFMLLAHCRLTPCTPHDDLRKNELTKRLELQRVVAS